MTERIIHHNIVHDVMKEIDALQSHVGEGNIEGAKDAFYALLRRFFREFLNIGYEFSAADVKDELKNSPVLDDEQSDQLIALIRDYEERAYSPDSFDTELLRDLMQRFRQIIYTIMQGSLSERLSFDSRIHIFFYRLYQRYHRFLESTFRTDDFWKRYHGVLEYLFIGEIGIAREEVRRLAHAFPDQKRPIRHLGRLVVRAEVDTLLREIDEGFRMLDSLLKSGNLEAASNQFVEIKKMYSGLPRRVKYARYPVMRRFFRRISALRAKEQVNSISNKVSAAREAIDDHDMDTAERLYLEVEEMFSHLPAWAQKRVRKPIHELGIMLYAS